MRARTATALVGIAKGYEATIRVRCGDRVGDAKSLIKLLSLGVESDSRIRVMAEGPDAEPALSEAPPMPISTHLLVVAAAAAANERPHP